ncbi:TraB/GumN family protein [Saprospiraceae bacterium]|nr:TraB/GumN family protein [Saprospiraceae bacterium]
MNKSFLRFLSILISISVFASCGASKKTMTVAPTNVVADSKFAPTEKALLWKIEHTNLAAPSYLYGTIHIIPKEDFFYPEGTLQSIDAVKKMVFEIDMNEMSDMGAQMQLMQKAMMKDGKTLKDLLSDEDYKVVSDHFSEMGLPMMMFERMKPAFLTVFASDDMSPTAMQSGAMKSYEMEFMEIAKSKKLEVGGLETIDYQLSVFDSIPYSDQAEMLVESIKMSGEGEDELAKMITIYKDQDLEGMAAMFSDESLGDMDILLNNRNRNWIPVMIEGMQKQATFFAVGAGHLVGEQGVIALLRAEGYTVTPISE